MRFATAVIIVSLLVPAGGHVRADETVVATHRVAPVYPQRQIDLGQAGWVEVSIVASPEGNPVDLTVTSASGAPEFEAATLRALREWRFVPATLDGRGVESHVTVVMPYTIEDIGIRPRQPFIRVYNRDLQSLNSGNLVEAYRAEIRARDSSVNLGELARLDMLYAKRAEIDGDSYRRLRHLQRAVIRDGAFVDDDTHAALLRDMLALQLNLRRLRAALETWDRLRALDPASEGGALSRRIETARNLVEGTDDLVVKGEVASLDDCGDCPGHWQYSPARAEIELRTVSGSIDRLDIRCERQRIVADAPSDGRWTLDESWGKCVVFVFANNGTEFTFVEMPRSDPLVSH